MPMRAERAADGTTVTGWEPVLRRVEKMSEVVAREIVHDMRGLPPATMLPPEAAMLERYRVGRASLREALRILEVHGLIVIRRGPRGGPMVAPVRSEKFADMTSLYLHLAGARYGDVLVARLVLEPLMARLAAERRDTERVGLLEQFVVPPTAPIDDARYIRGSSEFHSVLSGFSGNAVLDLMGRAVLDIYTDRLERMVFPGARSCLDGALRHREGDHGRTGGARRAPHARAHARVHALLPAAGSRSPRRCRRLALRRGRPAAARHRRGRADGEDARRRRLVLHSGEPCGSRLSATGER